MEGRENVSGPLGVICLDQKRVTRHYLAGRALYKTSISLSSFVHFTVIYAFIIFFTFISISIFNLLSIGDRPASPSHLLEQRSSGEWSFA
jgi:hypothetical protein